MLTGAQQHLWNEFEAIFALEADLVSAALALGADEVKPWSEPEIALARSAGGTQLAKDQLSSLREWIRSGDDPLGEAFCALRSAAERREKGATYTPGPIVRSMVEWAKDRGTPQRIVDPGTGSARFLLQAGQTFRQASLIGVEVDPLAALVARANLAVAGFAKRSRIILGDYRRFHEPISATTLYIGNPPYVRHHQIDRKWKEWLSDEAAKLGHKASQLAGLHVHFFLATARNARPGDFGAFITAAEWLDVNYGSLVRSLLAGELGGQSVTVIEPAAQPFPGTATTAAITTFEIASKPTSVFFRRIDSLRDLDGLSKGRKIHRDRLITEPRWSYLTRSAERPPDGYVELGELCRVHRGQVTGANDVWIAGPHSDGLPDSVLYRTITRAKEVFAADGLLDDASKLRCVIDLPVDLAELDASGRRAVNRFLKFARDSGASQGYVAATAEHGGPWAFALPRPSSLRTWRGAPGVRLEQGGCPSHQHRSRSLSAGSHERAGADRSGPFPPDECFSAVGPHVCGRSYEVRASGNGAAHRTVSCDAGCGNLAVIDPPAWSKEQLETDRVRAIVLFRKERMEEPLEDYLVAFDEYQGHVEELLETTVDLSQLEGKALDVLTDPKMLEAFRYLAAPPISADDLKVLAEAPSLTKGQLRKNPEDVRRLVETVRLVLDQRRFAWVVEGREPTVSERAAAVMASAALIAASRVQTKRRTTGKDRQEASVKQALSDLGLKAVAARDIPNVSLAPASGEFCGESRLGTRKADIVVRLWDHRVMPIECKVSNSSLNSVKRLNNGAAVKASTWQRDFGLRQVVPTAVLSGVYNLHHLVDAQERGLTIFWAHDLKPLTDWIGAAKT